MVPCACLPYAVVFHFHSVGCGRYLKSEERGLFVWVWSLAAHESKLPSISPSAVAAADRQPHRRLWLGLKFTRSASPWLTWRKLSLDTTESLQLLVGVRMRQCKRQCGHTESPRVWKDIDFIQKMDELSRDSLVCGSRCNHSYNHHSSDPIARDKWYRWTKNHFLILHKSIGVRHELGLEGWSTDFKHTDLSVSSEALKGDF